MSAGPETRRMGGVAHYLAEVDSTNAYAAMLAQEGAPEGAVVVSETQTAGRGRLGRKWVSPPGVNIYMSVILRPDMPPGDAPLVTLAASVALTRAIRGLYGLPAAIKWPNDALIHGRKTAGILTEMKAGQGRVRYIVLGVGVNVNMTRGLFPEDIRDASTSIMLELGASVERSGLIKRFLSELEGPYGMLTGGDRAGIVTAWRGLSCTLGRAVRVSAPGGEITGRAVDVGPDGALIVETWGGTRERVVCGDSEFV